MFLNVLGDRTCGTTFFVWKSLIYIICKCKILYLTGLNLKGIKFCEILHLLHVLKGFNFKPENVTFVVHLKGFSAHSSFSSVFMRDLYL